MGLRPGKCYRSKKDRAYSRVAVTVHRRNYIGATPGLKTRQFNMGNPLRKYSHLLNLVVDSSVQIRDNAIESARIAINRYLFKRLGKEGFFMKIRIYPHQILRENKQAQGAHADRIQQGMSHAFGKPIGRAIRVRPGLIIISVLVDEKGIADAKKALMRANARMPTAMHVEIRTDVESIGTLPKKVRDISEEVKTEEKAEEGAAVEGGEKPAEAKGGKEAAGKKGEAKPAAAGKEAAPKKEEKVAAKPAGKAPAKGKGK